MTPPALEIGRLLMRMLGHSSVVAEPVAVPVSESVGRASDDEAGSSVAGLCSPS